MCIANASAEGISWKNFDMLIDGWAADIYQIFKKESMNILILLDNWTL